MCLELALAIANAVRSKEEDDEDDDRLKSREILADFSGNFKKQNAFRIGDMTTVRKIDL